MQVPVTPDKKLKLKEECMARLRNTYPAICEVARVNGPAYL
jgi:hypothetical protein